MVQRFLGFGDNLFGMADFRNLVVWQKANKLSVATAEAVEFLKGDTGSILRRQLLRSTFSIQANIAEAAPSGATGNSHATPGLHSAARPSLPII